MSHFPQQGASGGSSRTAESQGAVKPASGPSAPPEAVWLPVIRDIYPDLLTKTYFLPPIHFRPVPRSVTSIAGQVVSVHEQLPPQGPRRRKRPFPPLPSEVAGRAFTSNPPKLEPLRLQDSDVQDDEAQNRVLRCLRALSESSRQVMMVISRLQFRKYLSNLGNPVDPALAALPTVALLPVNIADGECDILAILRSYGFLIGEIKSVGSNDYFKNSPETVQDQMIVKKVEEAVGQLNNQGTALNHLVSDMPPIKVTKVLILPNITSGQLQRALSTDNAVAQALCRCLQNAQDLPEAVSRCLCKDQLPQGRDSTVTQSQRDVTCGTASRGFSWLRARLQRQRKTSSTDSMEMYDAEATPLSTWWQHAVLDAGPDPNMTDHGYERLVARFCGPATSVDIPTLTAPHKVVRSLGEAVAETGLVMSSLALYPQQVDILNDSTLDSVFLVGPPGTGKTVLLIIKGMQLLQKGNDLYLLSICVEGRSVMILAEQQLNVSKRAARGPPATGTVHRHHFDFTQAGEVAAAVHILSVLAGGNPLFILVDEVGYNLREKFTEFCARLKASVPALSVWAAGLWLPVPLPAGMEKRELTLPLRFPPTVTDVVKLSEDLWVGRTCSYSPRPIPAATEGPEAVRLSHTRRLLGLPLPLPLPGHTGRWPENCVRCAGNVTRVLKDHLRVGQSNTVQWKDVLFLTANPSPQSALVQELDRCHVPVRVVKRHASLAELEDLALARVDSVMVTHRYNVQGLERRVVVGMGLESWYMLWAMGVWLVVGLMMLLCLITVVVAAGRGLPLWEVLVVVAVSVLLLVMFLMVIRKRADDVLGSVLGLALGLGFGLMLALGQGLVLGLMTGQVPGLGSWLLLWLVLVAWRKSRPSSLQKLMQKFVQRFGEGERLLGASRCTSQLVLIDDFTK